MDERIQRAVQDFLEREGASGVPFVVERPSEMSHGDYATNAALAASKVLGRNPREIADALAEAVMTALGESSVSHVSVAGPGFVNITLSPEAVSLAVAEADAKKDAWGRGAEESGRRIIVEYSNPNAFKEMHIGHLVGTVVGESIARLIESRGATVMRDTFGGDIGPNVAKAIWGLLKSGITEPTAAREIGAAYVTGANAYETDPKAKEEIDALNQSIYAGSDAELKSLWQKGRDISMEEFRRIWKLLGTHFDFEFFDSDTTETGLRVVQDGLEKGIFTRSDGAVIYDGEKKGVHTMVFITSHGTPTYETKDIGLAFLKEERWPSDRSIIITGNEQAGRFKTVLAALTDVAPILAAKTMNLTTGFLKLASGKMSSREGNVITAADFISEIARRSSEKNADPLIAEQVAVGALKFMILRQSPGSDIIFDAEQSLSLEGDSGPYLQYALVRARSVLAQAGEKSSADRPAQPYAIERLLMHYPEVVTRAAHELAPNLVVSYLLELAGAWNSFYAQERIIGGEHEGYKLVVARSFAQTMSNGLSILGIPTPARM